MKFLAWCGSTVRTTTSRLSRLRLRQACFSCETRSRLFFTRPNAEKKEAENEVFYCFDDVCSVIFWIHLAVALPANASRVPWQLSNSTGDSLGQRKITWCDACGKDCESLTQYTQQTDSERRSTDRPTSVADLCPACLRAAELFFEVLTKHKKEPDA